MIHIFIWTEIVNNIVILNTHFLKSLSCLYSLGLKELQFELFEMSTRNFEHEACKQQCLPMVLVICVNHKCLIEVFRMKCGMSLFKVCDLVVFIARITSSKNSAVHMCLKRSIHQSSDFPNAVKSDNIPKDLLINPGGYSL